MRCLTVAASVAVLLVWRMPIWQCRSLQGVEGVDRVLASEREDEARKTVSQVVGGVAVFASLYAVFASLYMALQTFEATVMPKPLTPTSKLWSDLFRFLSTSQNLESKLILSHHYWLAFRFWDRAEPIPAEPKAEQGRRARSQNRRPRPPGPSMNTAKLANGEQLKTGQ